MRLSEDRVQAIAKKMVVELRDNKAIRLKGLPTRLETEIQRVIMQDLMMEDEIDAEVESRIEAMSREIPYGSAEWNATFSQIKEDICAQRGYTIN